MSEASKSATAGSAQTAAATATTALLVIDMLSGWDFPDAEQLLPRAAAVAPRIAQLAQRCRAAGCAVIYANDNRGRWRSDLRRVVADAKDGDGDQAEIARLLEPQHEDYIVLKPKHSGFHATPLDLLLRDLGVRRLLLTGVTSDQCVLYTAADARMHDYDVVIARDAIATLNDERDRNALQLFEQALNAQTPLSTAIDLQETA